MTEKLTALEQMLHPHALQSQLQGETLQSFPENAKKLHGYRIFGPDLLAIPANMIINVYEDEYELPFAFFGYPGRNQTI